MEVRTAAQPPRDATTRWRALVFMAIAFVAVAHSLVAAFDLAEWSIADSLLDIPLMGPDSYMRLLRVQALWESGQWWDATIERIDPPRGLTQHWTRPLDAILLVLAAAAAPIVGFTTALHAWGLAIGPLLHIGAVLALVLATRPVVPQQHRGILALLFVAQPAVLAAYRFGRPDHHGLINLLVIAVLGLCIALLADPRSRRNAIAAGVASAAAIYVAVEAAAVVGLCLAFVSALWVAGLRPMARVMARWSAAAFITLLAALFIERGPSDWAALEFDRLSAAHVVLLGSVAAFWGATVRLDRSGSLFASLWPRLAWLAVGLAVLALTVMALGHDVLVGPLAGVDPLYRQVRIEQVAEMQPLLGREAFAGPAWHTLADIPVQYLGIALPAALFLVHQVVVTRGARRRIWLLIAVGAGMFVALTLLRVRWAYYAGTLLVIPYAVLVGHALDGLGRRLRPAAASVLRPLVLALAGVWIFLPGVAVTLASAGSTEGSDGPELCDQAAAAPFLADPRRLGAEPRRVMAFIDAGPELLYRTPHSVLVVPNHRMRDGFRVTYEVMTASEAPRAGALLRAHDVDLVLVCSDAPREREFYGLAGDGSSFYEALASGRVPAFLTEIETPAAKAAGVRLYATSAPALTPGTQQSVKEVTHASR